MSKNQGHKEITVKEAKEKAALAKSKEQAEKGIKEEVKKLYKKQTHSIQQLLAHCGVLEKYDKDYFLDKK